jgi:hypothetical protein
MVDSIKEITGMNRGSRDGRIYEDILVVLPAKASAHFNVPEHIKLATRPTLVLSRSHLINTSGG